MIRKSEFLTIIPRTDGSHTLSFQFSDSWYFIKYLKRKILVGKHRRLVSKEKDRDNLFRQELERTIYYFEVHKKYWKRIWRDLCIYFRKVYVVKKGITYQIENERLVNITNEIRPNDEDTYIADYEKKKYKVYRDRD